MHTEMYKSQLNLHCGKKLQEIDFIVLTSFRTNMEFTKKIFVFSVTLMEFIETTWKSLGEIMHEHWIKASIVKGL